MDRDGPASRRVRGYANGEPAHARFELRSALRRYHDALAPGSFVIVSHATDEDRPKDVAQVIDLYNKVSRPLIPRTRAELSDLLAGWELVEPGVVFGSDWRPDPADGPPPTDPGRYATLVAVGRKP